MNKLTILICSLIAVGGFYIILNNSNDPVKPTEPQTQSSTVEPKVENLEQAESALKTASIPLEEKTETYYQYVGAIDGAKYNSGQPNAIEIYIFKDPSKITDITEQLKTPDNSIVSKGNILILVHSKDTKLVEQINSAL